MHPCSHAVRVQLGKGEVGDRGVDVNYYFPRFSDIGAMKGSQLSKREHGIYGERLIRNLFSGVSKDSIYEMAYRLGALKGG